MECSSAKARKYARKVEKDIRGWGRKSDSLAKARIPKSPLAVLARRWKAAMAKLQLAAEVRVTDGH